MPAAAAILLLVLWELAVVVFHVRPFIAPAPTAVAATLYAKFGLLIANLVPTATEAVAGFIIGNTAAIVIATVFVYQRTAEEAFFPIAVMVHTIPVMAYAPILVLLLGNGLSAKVAIAALICFFPTLVNMTRGLRAVSPQQMELMRILSASPSEIFFKLRLKCSLPYSVRGAQDRRGDFGHRRDRRRMDRRDDRHRRAHHSGDLQFRTRRCSTRPSSSAQPFPRRSLA